MEKNINVISDTVNKDLKTNITDNKDTSLMSSIYDTTYNDIIKQII